MPPFAFTLLTAFCLVFVIEGLLYALFPEQLKNLMSIALSIPSRQLRFFGLAMALLGTISLYILKAFYIP